MSDFNVVKHLIDLVEETLTEIDTAQKWETFMQHSKKKFEKDLNKTPLSSLLFDVVLEKAFEDTKINKRLYDYS